MLWGTRREGRCRRRLQQITPAETKREVRASPVGAVDRQTGPGGQGFTGRIGYEVKVEIAASNRIGMTAVHRKNYAESCVSVG